LFFVGKSSILKPSANNVIEKNIQIVRDRIVGACRRSGRDPSSVTLIAVSKLFAADAVAEGCRHGLVDFGENYIQELLEKKEALTNGGIRWHFIGHLQTNKVRQIAGWVHLVHSVDSLRLGNAISEAGRKTGRTIPVLIEVNTTGEGTKFGLRPDEILEFSRKLRTMPFLGLQGLMTMGPLSENPADSRPSFRLLRELKEGVERDGHPMEHLSMGMTNDFEVAIEEGATLLRVGTAIFGARNRGGH
jgi:pyridoxal phosphate enzyme (YggS family)